MDVGKNIRCFRKKRNLTMKELGIKVGISEQGISNYERNEREPSINVLIKIANTLGVTLNDLIYNTNLLLQYTTLDLIKEIERRLENE